MNAVDDWHVLVVQIPVIDENGDEEENDPRTTLLHPGHCPVTVSSANGGAVRHECVTAEHIEHSGFYGMFEHNNSNLAPGIWYIRPWVEKIVGPDWTEYDAGWFVHRLKLEEEETDAASVLGSASKQVEGDAGGLEATPTE